MHAHPQATPQRVLTALAITAAFMLAEAATGVLANSLALVTDAVHNLSDVVALALSWYALRLALRPAHAGKTYGYHRAGILVALVNSSVLIGLALVIFFQAYQRLLAPQPVGEAALIVVAALGFAINIGSAWLLHRGSQQDLSVRSAFVHLASDALASVATLLAGILIALTGQAAFDALASMLIGLFILWSGTAFVRETVSILLEGKPHDLDMSAMLRDVLGVHGVRGVHDLHVWSLSQNVRALSVHVLTDDLLLHEGSTIQRDINSLLVNK